MLLLLLAGWGTTEAKRHAKTDDVLNLVASYPALICSTPPDSFTTFSYAKVLINVDRRNLTLEELYPHFRESDNTHQKGYQRQKM